MVHGGRAVIIQPATPSAVAPLITLADGLSERESQVTRLCMQGLSTRQLARALALSPHTVQDHLKSIFAKTGVRSRSELVGQIFLEHYVPRWEDLAAQRLTPEENPPPKTGGCRVPRHPAGP